MGELAGKTLFITGASRGIGKAIAMRAAQDGANIVVAAKTAEPHPRLAGTIYTAAEEIESAGGKALPLVVDIREEEQVQSAVTRAVEHFGGTLVIESAPLIVKQSADVWGVKKNSTEIEIMAQLRNTFDPGHIVNRGRFVVT